MKSRNLYLGIVLVAMGVLSLLVSLDVIDFSWTIAWRLWPMLLVFIGIVMLPLKDWLKAVLLLAAMAVGVALYQYEAGRRGNHWFFTQSIGKESIELSVV